MIDYLKVFFVKSRAFKEEIFKRNNDRCTPYEILKNEDEQHFYYSLPNTYCTHLHLECMHIMS